MIKLVYCINKKQGLTDEEFFYYWEKVHGPIGARIPHLRRLVQSHRVLVSSDSRPPDYDGVAELWFDDMDAPLMARRSPEWKASARTKPASSTLTRWLISSPRSTSSWMTQNKLDERRVSVLKLSSKNG